MADSTSLQLEQDELLSRAAELETPIAGVPLEDPVVPCALTLVAGPTKRLVRSSESMRRYLEAGQRERDVLAQSLRNAAKAYGELDDNAAEALDTESSVTAVNPDAVEDDQSVPSETVSGDLSADDVYVELKTAAAQIAEPDQGVSLAACAEVWAAYGEILQDSFYMLRPFQYWEGDARAAVEASFDAHRQWMAEIADMCATLATQARDFLAAHVYATQGDDDVTSQGHPTLEGVQACEKAYSDAVAAGDEWTANVEMRHLQHMQNAAEWVRSNYADSLDFASLLPPMPPTAVDIPDIYGAADEATSRLVGAAAASAAAGLALARNGSTVADDAAASGGPLDGLTDSGLSGGSGMGGSGGALGGSSAADDSYADDEYGPAAMIPATAAATAAEPSVRAASAGAFGGLGGGGGAAADQLQPRAGQSGAGPIPGGLRDGAILGRGGAGIGAGGGSGMVPVGGGGAGGPGQGDGSKSGKGGKGDSSIDESLYVEERPWTEPVIGKRRRQDTEEG